MLEMWLKIPLSTTLWTVAYISDKNIRARTKLFNNTIDRFAFKIQHGTHIAKILRIIEPSFCWGDFSIHSQSGKSKK